MNRGQLLELHAHLTDDARKLMVVKNRDYGENDDPFRNFRRWGLLGIIVRLGDKLARLETFVERGDLKVVDEQVRDAVLDIINYAVLFEGYNVDGTGSASRDTAGTRFTRASDQGPEPCFADFGTRNTRSHSRGGGRISPAKTWSPADLIAHGFKVGASAGGSRRKPVGREHRRGKVKK